MGEAPRRRSVAAWAGAAACATIGAAVCASAGGAGCNTHQCDSSFVTLGALDAGTGEILEASPAELLWESSPAEGPWLDFPGQRTYFLVLDEEAMRGRTIVEIVAYIASDPNPQANYTIASGNLAELFGDPRMPYVNVSNQTCAHYYVRVVARAGASRAETDASVDADGSAPGDGSPDASSE